MVSWTESPFVKTSPSYPLLHQISTVFSTCFICTFSAFIGSKSRKSVILFSDLIRSLLSSRNKNNNIIRHYHSRGWKCSMTGFPFYYGHLNWSFYQFLLYSYSSLFVRSLKIQFFIIIIGSVQTHIQIEVILLNSPRVLMIIVVLRAPLQTISRCVVIYNRAFVYGPAEFPTEVCLHEDNENILIDN